jgi:hypothetical protein
VTVTVQKEDRIFGLYRDFPSLRSGVDSLKALCFDNRDISVLFPEAAVSETFSPDERAFESAIPGEQVAFIGGALGWLTYVRPERQGLIATALAGLGVPKPEADLYERNLRDGALLVCIRSSSAKRIETAAGVLNLTGAERVVTSRALLQSEGDHRLARPERHAGDQLSALALLC